MSAAVQPVILAAMLRVLLLLLLCLGPVGPAAAQGGAPVPEGARIAFLGLTWIDTSTEGDYFGDRPDEAARLRMAGAMVRERFAAEGYEFLDLAPVAQRLEATVNPAKCYGCDTRMGEVLGADYVLVGEVQKVSNLIIDMNLQLRAVPSGDLAAGRSVSIRGNTDDSWARGIRYLLDNAIFDGEDGK